MRPLKLLPEFMEAQLSILQPLSTDCLTQKRCKLDTLTKYVSRNKQLTNKVVSTEYKKSVSEFEKSHDNIVKYCNILCKWCNGKTKVQKC